MADGHPLDGAGEGRPARPFGTAAGARALGEIQAEGLRAAGSLVNRLIELVDGTTEAVVAEAGRIEEEGTPAPAVESWAAMWAQLLERSVQALGGRPTSGGTEPAALALGTSAGVAVAIEAAPGTTGQAELWLHNATPDATGPLAVRCGPLQATSGPGIDLVLDPATIDLLPARSSRGILLVAAVPADCPSGVYRNLLQVDGAPELWATVELRVAEPGADGEGPSS